MVKDQGKSTKEIIDSVMSDDSSVQIEEPQKPKGSNKIVKRVGIILFVLMNAVVLYFIAKDALS